jgi:hypothetical protein
MAIWGRLSGMGVSPSLAVAAAALGAGAVACGSSGYQYVENDDLGVYARLPDDWAVYDEADLYPDDSDRERERRTSRMWLRTFDAADEPSVEASRSAGNDTPTGIMEVRGLTPQEREQLDLGALRGGGNPALDPVAAAASGAPNVEIISDDPVEFNGGFTGVHTVFVVDEGGTPVVTERMALRNATTTAIALFQVSCSETCYFETHKDDIADLVESWTIQEVRR